jgi:tetratricopeptide (TPR) repeat protein
MNPPIEFDVMLARAAGDKDAAVAHLEVALSERPDDWRLWKQLGTLEAERNRFEAAANAFDAAIGCPNAPQTALRLDQAGLLAAQGEADAALRALDVLDIADDDRPTLASLRLRCLRQRRNRALAHGTMWQVMIEVSRGDRGFFQAVEVVTADRAELLELIREDMGEAYADARIESVVAKADVTDELVGVHWAAETRVYYPR